MNYVKLVIVSGILMAVFTVGAHAQEGRPPAKVETVPIEKGTLAPTNEFKGTVFFKEVSAVATEVSGLVEAVGFEEGARIRKGETLVQLDHELLDAHLEAALAVHRQRQAATRLEEIRLSRNEDLLADEVITPQEFDDIKYGLEALSHSVAAAQADIDRIRREIQKKTISAPFDGIVIDRQTEIGEWKSEGDTLAVFAREGLHDVIVNLPETNLLPLEADMPVDMTIAGKAVRGRIVAILPKGDTATRTFPIKIRVEKEPWLMEGMSAAVRIPTRETVTCLFVPRDAIIQQPDGPAIVTERDGTARIVPVTVLGYDAMRAGIATKELTEGDAVMVKGHERLRPNQPVEIVR